MKRSILVILFLFLILDLYLYSKDPKELYRTDQILIKTKTNLSESDIKRFISIYNINEIELISTELKIYTAKFDSNRVLVDELHSKIQKDSTVVFVQKDYLLYQANYTPNDPLFSQQWSLDRINFPEAWYSLNPILMQQIDEMSNGEPIVVGVIDFGFDINHNDINFSNGWNFLTNNSSITLGTGHGTAVSGVLGAIGDNNIGMIGAAPGVEIVPVQVGSTPGVSTESRLFQALDYYHNQKKEWLNSNGNSGKNIIVLNMSLGFTVSSSTYNSVLYNEFFDKLASLGILSICAAGNSLYQFGYNTDLIGHFPSASRSEYLLSTGSSDGDDSKSDFSHFGIETVQLFAPGNNLPVYCKPNLCSPNNYRIDGGTSYAAPLVTGTVAMMFAAANQDFLDFYKDCPSCGVIAIRKMIMDNVDQVSGFDQLCESGGILNMEAAVDAIKNFDYNTWATTTGYYGLIMDEDAPTNNFEPNEYEHLGNNNWRRTWPSSQFRGFYRFDMGSDDLGNSDYQSSYVKSYDLPGVKLEEVLNIRAGYEIRIGPCTEFLAGSEVTMEILSSRRYNRTNGTSSDECGMAKAFKISVLEDEIVSINSLASLQVTPNPTSGQINIRLDLEEATLGSLVILNEVGVEISNILDSRSLSRGSHNFDFDLSNFASGVYIIALKTEQGLFSQKVVNVK